MSVLQSQEQSGRQNVKANTNANAKVNANGAMSGKPDANFDIKNAKAKERRFSDCHKSKLIRWNKNV